MKAIILLIGLFIICINVNTQVLVTAADTLSYNTISANSWSDVDTMPEYRTVGEYLKRFIKPDTNVQYIKEIQDKCDTTYVKRWTPKIKIDGVQYFEQMTALKDTCYKDTVWADKVIIYLTPEAAKKLKADYK